MPSDLSPVALARVASALTLDDAATITGMSRDGYEQAEERPLQMTLGEFNALCAELNSDGRKVVQDWVDSFFGV